jgi:hypothetical protein
MRNKFLYEFEKNIPSSYLSSKANYKLIRINAANK